MSTLWTPGGEIPVDRNAPTRPEPDPPVSPTPDDATSGAEVGDDEQLDQMRRQLLEAPAADVVAQHLMAFYELAAMHLSTETPKLADAKLAIDAVEALLSGLSGRLGQAESAIASALPQLKMAFIEAKDRVDG